MKRLEHTQLPTPEKSKKLIDCRDLVGRRPLEGHEVLANTTGSVRYIDATCTVGGVSW